MTKRLLKLKERVIKLHYQRSFVATKRIVDKIYGKIVIISKGDEDGN